MEDGPLCLQARGHRVGLGPGGSAAGCLRRAGALGQQGPAQGDGQRRVGLAPQLSARGRLVQHRLVPCQAQVAVGNADVAVEANAILLQHALVAAHLAAALSQDDVFLQHEPHPGRVSLAEGGQALAGKAQIAGAHHAQDVALQARQARLQVDAPAALGLQTEFLVGRAVRFRRRTHAGGGRKHQAQHGQQDRQGRCGSRRGHAPSPFGKASRGQKAPRGADQAVSRCSRDSCS